MTRLSSRTPRPRPGASDGEHGRRIRTERVRYVYGLLQCRNDLSAAECSKQLQYLLGYFPNSVNCRYVIVRGFSCFIRQDINPITVMDPFGRNASTRSSLAVDRHDPLRHVYSMVVMHLLDQAYPIMMSDMVQSGRNGSASTRGNVALVHDACTAFAIMHKLEAPPPWSPAPYTPAMPCSCSCSCSSKTQKMAVIVALATAANIIFFFLSAALFIRRRQKRIATAAANQESNEDEETEGVFRFFSTASSAGPKRFAYDVLAAATGSFSDDRKLGEGGFGSVYRGILEEQELNLCVAIKRVSSSCPRKRKEYASEVRIISRLRHRNLVKLIGWCHNHEELLLVYELMSNRSLDIHLYSSENVLSWQRRYDIILGIGSALVYLHQDCDQGVLHRDIKPSNVMLDASFSAKLGDFGLARLVDHARGAHTTELAGTMGYMDPACMDTGRFSTQSDMYSFGVVLLEVACGRQPVVVHEGKTIHLARRVLELHRRGAILDAADCRLKGEFDARQMECVLVVGLWCTQQDPALRPSIRQAVSALRLETSLPTTIMSSFNLDESGVTG